MATAISTAVLLLVASFDLFAFVLAIGAEMRRSTGIVVPDEYDERTYCSYDSDASTGYGLSAFGLLMLSQGIVVAVTRCLCCGRGLAGGSRSCAVACFVVSWLTFIVAEACLLAGSAKNAYHTRYFGYFDKKDLSTCATLRKGVFAAGAAFTLIYTMASLVFYWCYSRAETGGWVKHHNEVGLGMTDYGPDKGGYGRSSNS